MRPLVAHCHRALGSLYATTSQREQARVALATAIDLYRAMDMTFWLPQAEAVLAQVEAGDTPESTVKARVELGESPRTAQRTLSRIKTETSPSPNWRGNCGAQHYVRHPGEGMDLAEVPEGNLLQELPASALAEDLAVNAAGQQKIRVGSVTGQVPDRPVGGHR